MNGQLGQCLSEEGEERVHVTVCVEPHAHLPLLQINSSVPHHHAFKGIQASRRRHWPRTED